jgi:hypothetical protein
LLVSPDQPREEVTTMTRPKREEPEEPRPSQGAPEERHADEEFTFAQDNGADGEGFVFSEEERSSQKEGKRKRAA